LQAGDSLIAWKLDRLARLRKQLVEAPERLQTHDVGRVSLTEAINTKARADGVTLFPSQTLISL